MPRLLTHLLHTPLATRRAFPPAVQEAIRKTIADGEQTHRGELRFVVEGDWPVLDVMSGKTVRDRALEVFGLARVWDTIENTGVLIYVLLCEHKVEIVTDRGLQTVADHDTWEDICGAMTTAFRGGRFEEGSLQAVRSINALLLRHFPSDGHNPNELPDMPIILR